VGTGNVGLVKRKTKKGETESDGRLHRSLSPLRESYERRTRGNRPMDMWLALEKVGGAGEKGSQRTEEKLIIARPEGMEPMGVGGKTNVLREMFSENALYQKKRKRRTKTANRIIDNSILSRS